MLTAYYVLIALLVIELILQVTWQPLYYRSGIPLFNVRIPAPAAARLRLVAAGLEHDLAEEGALVLAFRQLPDGNIAFRESYGLTLRRYYPAMHGLIVIGAGQREVRVMGLANWFTWGLLLLMGAMIAVRPQTAVMLLILPVLFLGYWLQRRRYQNVVDAVREQLAYDRSLLLKLSRLKRP
jgi:hypothetical protein